MTQPRDPFGRWSAYRLKLPAGAHRIAPARTGVLIRSTDPRWIAAAPESKVDGGLALPGDERVSERKLGPAGASLGLPAEWKATVMLAVTGLLDRVGDIIVPDAFVDTLKTKTPKIVLFHDWDKPCGKCLTIAELPPGDSSLPSKLPNGAPWPKPAGALVTEVLFNQDTSWGRDGWGNAKFYETDQEWCVDAETEILTERGWLTYDQLDVGDLAYTMDPATLAARFQPVEAVNIWPEAPRRLRRIETGGFSSLTTAAHRWPVRFADGHPGWRTTADLTTSNGIWRALPHADAPRDPKWSDAMVELVAWYWTEGWVEHHNACIGQSAVHNPEHVSAIRVALDAAFPGAWSEATTSGGMTRFRLARQASAALQALCGHRKVPRADFLLTLTRAQLHLFIARCLDGDGHRTPSGQTTWYQVDPDGVAAFQMACALAGVPTAARQPDDYGNRHGRVPHSVALLRSAVATPLAAIHTKGYSTRPPRTPAVDEWVEHTGIVWCPTTASGTWLARRRGSVYFTGNSIGYNVPSGGAKKRSDGVRMLGQLELLEGSEVLWGAMPQARTLSLVGQGNA